MALPPVLSEEALNRFRTKHCERLLVAGACHFGDRCQYSHNRAWLRRNPKKHTYSPQLCTYMKCGSCENGETCKFAHSRDEELYHPVAYKSVLCEMKDACDCYYCPFAHLEAELRKPACVDSKSDAVRDNTKDAVARASGQHRRRGARQSRQNEHDLSATASGSMPAQPSSLDESASSTNRSNRGAFIRVDEFLQIAMPSGEETGLTGRFVSGLLQPKGGEVMDCHVKLVQAGRKECVEAAKVVKEIRRWMNIPRNDGRSRALDLRRTVATIYLAIPEEPDAERVISFDGSLARDVLKKDYQLSRRVCSLMSQLVSEVQTLHGDGIAHWCISPHSIRADTNSSLFLGDFLGKIRALSLMNSGLSDPSSMDRADWEWAAWYPQEVQHAFGENDADARRALTEVIEQQRFAIDVWQLGVTLFYVLTGEHMYGSLQNPKVVCENICRGRPVNLGMLKCLPFFKHFCQMLSSHEAAERPSACTLKLHPLLWSLSDSSCFLDALPSWLVEILTEHLPCSSSFGRSTPVAQLSDAIVKTLAEHVMLQKDLSQISWTSEEFASAPIPQDSQQRTLERDSMEGSVEKNRTTSTCSTRSSPTSDTGISVTQQFQQSDGLSPFWLQSQFSFSSPFGDEAMRFQCPEICSQRSLLSSFNYAMDHEVAYAFAKTPVYASVNNFPAGFALHVDPMEPAKVLNAFCASSVDQELGMLLPMGPMNIYTSQSPTSRLETEQFSVSAIRCTPESDSESLFHKFPFDMYHHGRIYSII